MARISAIGFDADDTLWHNERFFRMTQERFAGLLADYVDPDPLHERLIAAERRNLGHYGFGIKGFVLSMIETAIEVSAAQVPAQVIAELIAAGQEMLSHPIELLPHVRETVEALAAHHPLVLITKGDLLDQERKLAQSGLGDFFDAVEIVSHKTPRIYAEAFTRYEGGVEAALMAGNSLKSDVLPMIEAGGWGIHLPHDLTWALEHEVTPQNQPRFAELPDISHLPNFIEGLVGG